MGGGEVVLWSAQCCPSSSYILIDSHDSGSSGGVAAALVMHCQKIDKCLPALWVLHVQERFSFSVLQMCLGVGELCVHRMLPLPHAIILLLWAPPVARVLPDWWLVGCWCSGVAPSMTINVELHSELQ